jgi:NADH-quinone oxidoreductase subunit C
MSEASPVQELADRLAPKFPDAVVARGEVSIVIAPGELHDALRWLAAEPDVELDFLSDLTATDWPDRDPRFWLAYHLYSSLKRHRLRVKVGVSGDDPRVPSVVGLFPTANWFEREVFDLFGVTFDGHPRLTRILMPDDWDGHPLRKDYELGGVGTAYRGAFIPPVDQRSGG